MCEYTVGRTFPSRSRFRSKKRETPIIVSTRLAPSSVKPARRRDGGIGSLRLKPRPRPPLLGAREEREAGRRCVCGGETRRDDRMGG